MDVITEINKSFDRETDEVWNKMFSNMLKERDLKEVCPVCHAENISLLADMCSVCENNTLQVAL